MILFNYDKGSCFVNLERSVPMSNDYSKLLGRMTEKFGTQANFADAMKLSERSI